MRRAEIAVLVVFVAGLPRGVEGQDRPPPKRLATPVADGPFLRPAAGDAAESSWGIKGGIAVGLWPTRGPRGLIRVYAPYLGRLAPLNLVAVEPVARGTRVGRKQGRKDGNRDAASIDGGHGSLLSCLAMPRAARNTPGETAELAASPFSSSRRARSSVSGSRPTSSGSGASEPRN